MASGSESASEKVAEKWEVGPAEDVVQALMEKLVDPRLPLRVSASDPPSKDAQKSIARQMHAVVLLYNYYHRKQKPDLRFLDFVPLCKLAVVLRPPLIAFTTLMNESESVELNGTEDQLSVTEQAIKDACDIAVALDASKDVPNTEGWPISKVAVLLIDSKKENCYLQFGAFTEGVWSLIEKALNESNINADISAEEMFGNKRKRNNQSASTDDSEFLQFGYDAVKDATGFDSSDLAVLETHVTYSISKLKSATQFYMLQCSQSFNVKNQVPLKYLVERLQGPLAEKSYGSWTATPVVEFYHMLPYVGFITRWLLRKDLSLPSLNGCNAQSTMHHSEKEITESRILDLPALNCNDRDMDHTDNNSSRMKVDSCEKITYGSIDGNIKNHKDASGGKEAKPVNLSQRTAKDGNVMEKFSKRCDIVDSAKKLASRVKLEIRDNDDDDHDKGLQSCPSRGLSQRTVISDSVNKKSKRCDLEDSYKKEESRIKHENLDIDGEECHKCSLSGPLRGLQRMNSNDFKKTCSKSEDTSNNLKSKIRVYHHRRKNISSTQHDSHVLVDGVNLNMVDPLKSYGTECRDEKVSGENGAVTVLCNQNEIAVTENQQVQFAANTNYNAEVQILPASEDMQNALALLYRKRQELCSQICGMEDMLALYEENIERIRDGGEVGLARQCIESIISGNYHMLLKNEIQIQDKDHHPQPGEDHCMSQCEKQIRLSDTYLPGKSSCQDLEYICLKNNWRLPRYLVEPLDGKFLSKVEVKSKDFNLSSKGSLEFNPCEARESAAAHIIAKIHHQAAE